MGFDGFDSVELVMGLEDELEISIPDKDAERLKTAGELLDYLLTRVAIVPMPEGAICRTARKFYYCRRLLASWAGIPTHTIRPSTPTDHLLPSQDDFIGRQEKWSQLREVLRLDIGVLRAPRHIRIALSWVFLTALTAAIALPSMASVTLRATILALVLVSGSAIMIVLWAWGRRIANEIPPRFQTVGAIVGHLRLREFQDQPHLVKGHWTRHEIWELVRNLTASSAVISPTQIRRDTRWSELSAM